MFYGVKGTKDAVTRENLTTSTIGTLKPRTETDSGAAAVSNSRRKSKLK